MNLVSNSAVFHLPGSVARGCPLPGTGLPAALGTCLQTNPGTELKISGINTS